MSVDDPIAAPPLPEHTPARNRSTLFAQAVRVGCKVASVVVVARLVAPADHGLFAMAASFTYCLTLFRDVGLGTAAVQVPTLSAAQLSSLRGAHLFLGALIAVLTLALAPVAAWVYATPPLIPLLGTMSVAFVLMGAGGFPRAQLARELRFAELARIDVIVAVIATGAMIVGGALGARAYSFAIFLIVAEGLNAALAWRAYPNQPKISADPRSLGELWRTGTQVTGYHILNQLLGLLDTFAIGRFFGAHVLGLYNRPAQLLALGNQFVVAPLAEVALATLSRIGPDLPRFRQQVAQTVTVTSHLAFPLATICLAVPEETVRLVLGTQWIEAAPLLRWLAFGAFVNAITVLAFAVNVAAGQARKLFSSVAVALPLTAGAAALGLPYGAIGVAAALAAINVLLAWPRWWWMLRGTPVSAGDFVSALVGPGFANLTLGIGLTAGRLCAESASWSVRLLSAGLGGLVAVTLLAAIWPRLRREGRELLTHLPRWRSSP